MTALFADTWFFQALLSSQDQHHHQVVDFLRNHNDLLVTTRWVFAETANALGGTTQRHLTARFLIHTEQDPGLMIAGPSDAVYQSGLELYSNRPDKNWSLTDCISFAVMREHGLDAALIGDHHFTEAGFRALFAE